MATWDTGLKNYVYLPLHPKDHPINLKGTYTVRLVVEGKDGSFVEDRVTVEVANVIPNAIGGNVISPDQKVILSVPEQALLDSFRLISIKQTNKTPDVVGSDRGVIGKVYEFREADEKFTKSAELKIAFTEEDIGSVDPEKLGIYAYDTNKKEWVYLKSQRSEKDNIITANIQKLYTYYSLMVSDLAGEGSMVKRDIKDEHVPDIAIMHGKGHYLLKSSFEDSLGEWSNRDGMVGAEVSLVDDATFDGTKALKITNTHVSGNFAVNVLRSSFNIKEYPIVQFDYRIASDIKTNFLVKVSGRWYEIGFTDDPKTLQDKRVNIAHIGDIEGIVADDQWHTAQFDLREMLLTKTQNTVVEQMIMADWDVPGFMKLQFGKNAKDASYYVDNFSIGRDISAGLDYGSETLIVDHFNQKNITNLMGGETLAFSDGSMGRAATTFVKYGKGHALDFNYDVSQVGSFAGFSSHLKKLDLRDYQVLKLSVKGKQAGQSLLVGLKDLNGNEQKVLLDAFLSEGISDQWQTVSIPLVAFSSELDWSAVNSLNFSIQHGLNDTGSIQIDDIAFSKKLSAFSVTHFDDENDENLIGGKQWLYANGAAAINGKFTHNSPNGIYTISFGGNIGDVSGFDSGLSYAGWSTSLKGVNCEHCDVLSFRIKGAKGGEIPNIYLSDGSLRWGVDVEQYAEVTKDWQTVTIPLEDFSSYGVDLSHLAELQMVFEWDNMSGTVFLDDIQFGISSSKSH